MMDYVAFNSTSTIDLLGDHFKISKSQLYSVERLIAKRKHEGANQYLVKWTNYSPYEATWEDEDSITQPCIEYFNNPKPNKNKVLNEVAQFRMAVESFLKSARDLPVSFSFSTDVFKFLFYGKGSRHKGWQYLEACHFSRTYFPEGWDKCLDVHGDGIQIQYPAMVRSFLSWSPVKYIQGKHAPVKAQRCYHERVTFKCNKVAGSM